MYFERVFNFLKNNVSILGFFFFCYNYDNDSKENETFGSKPRRIDNEF